jgi:hypothetical protein
VGEWDMQKWNSCWCSRETTVWHYEKGGQFNL